MESSSRSARDSGGLITIGRIVGPHGLRGEVRVRPETDFPEGLARRREVLLVRGGRAEPVVITGARPHRGGLLLSIAGVDDADAAARLRGADLAIPRAALAPLEAGSFYIFEIVGMRVRTPDGHALGVVAEVMRGPAHDIYVVRGEDGEWLLPAVHQVVRHVDRDARVITVEVPVGLPRSGRTRPHRPASGA